mgnify:CR=1 FL=1|jgi:hypothetical protein
MKHSRENRAFTFRLIENPHGLMMAANEMAQWEYPALPGDIVRCGDDLRMRPLESGDWDKGYIQLLSQLTTAPQMPREEFVGILRRMRDRYLPEIEADARPACLLACLLACWLACVWPCPCLCLVFVSLHYGCCRRSELNQLVLSKCYYTVVVENLQTKKIVAAATLLVEFKLIRGGHLSGHVEDVVVRATTCPESLSPRICRARGIPYEGGLANWQVDKSMRGRSLGLMIINALKWIASAVGCYKLILDCSQVTLPVCCVVSCPLLPAIKTYF